MTSNHSLAGTIVDIPRNGAATISSSAITEEAKVNANSVIKSRMSTNRSTFQIARENLSRVIRDLD